MADPIAVLMVESTIGVLAGFVELSIRTNLGGFERKRVGYMEGLFVKPEARGQGLVRKFFKRRASGQSSRTVLRLPAIVQVGS